MRFAIWQSVNYADCALGYKPGSDMRKVWDGEIEDAPTTLMLERIFTQFQRVDEDHMPPDGYTGRSLSVGDVVQFANGEWLSCEMVGWLKLDLKEEV